MAMEILDSGLATSLRETSYGNFSVMNALAQNIRHAVSDSFHIYNSVRINGFIRSQRVGFLIIRFYIFSRVSFL